MRILCDARTSTSARILCTLHARLCARRRASRARWSMWCPRSCRRRCESSGSSSSSSSSRRRMGVASRPRWRTWWSYLRLSEGRPFGVFGTYVRTCVYVCIYCAAVCFSVYVCKIKAPSTVSRAAADSCTAPGSDGKPTGTGQTRPEL